MVGRLVIKFITFQVCGVNYRYPNVKTKFLFNDITVVCSSKLQIGECSAITQGNKLVLG